MSRWLSTFWIRPWSWMKTHSMICHWRSSPDFLPEMQLFVASGILLNLDPHLNPQGQYAHLFSSTVRKVESDMRMEIRAIKTEMTDEDEFYKRLSVHEPELLRCFTNCLQGGQEAEVLATLHWLFRGSDMSQHSSVKSVMHLTSLFLRSAERAGGT